MAPAGSWLLLGECKANRDRLVSHTQRHQGDLSYLPIAVKKHHVHDNP